MKHLWPGILLAGAMACGGQTVANPYNVLHPITTDINHPHAPTSLNQQHGAQPAAAKPAPRAAAPPQPAVPAAIVAKIDASLVASKISVIGTISGIKGKLYVTNIGSQTLTPTVLMAVCNANGFKIGTAKKAGDALSPNEAVRIDVIATNVGAADFKLMQLSGAPVP